MVLSVLAITFTACEKEELSEDALEENLIINTNGTNGRALVTDTDILNSIKDLDIDVGLITKGDFHLPDGSVEERIYIGNDITFTEKELKMLSDAHSGTQRQYRTFNLVTGSNRTIDILGYTGGSQSLSSKAQTALQWAVDNYNNLSTTLQFNLTYGTNHQAA